MKTLMMLVLIFAAYCAQAQERSGTTERGVKYKIQGGSGGRKIRLNDIVTFHFVQATDQDSVMMSSYQMGRPIKIQIRPAERFTDLMDVFILMTLGDSAMVRVPTDSIFKLRPEDRPDFLPPGSDLVYALKIVKIQTEDELLEEQAEAIAAEKASLKKYLSDNHLKPYVTSSGLMFITTKFSNSQQRPEPGDTVLINYIASTVDGKVFDSSIASELKKSGIYQSGRIYGPIRIPVAQGGAITAWDEGLLAMNEGSWSKFILPSELAFGAEGYGKYIKPYSTLIIDIELVKIFRRQKDKVLSVKRPVHVKDLPAVLAVLHHEIKNNFSGTFNTIPYLWLSVPGKFLLK